VSVIISDQRMPNMTGVELLSKSIATHPETIRILLTGYTDINSVIDAINSGQIYRYVTKPWDSIDLENAVDKAVERFEVGAELKIKNSALVIANEELKNLDKAKSDFMMLVNHELKTPLTAIMSFSDLLKETSLDADQTKFLARIQTSTLRLQSLVNDVLEYLSAEARMTPVLKKKISSTKIEGMRPVSFDALLKKNQLVVKYDIEPCTILVDEKILQNVMARLIENALKFSNPSCEILVRARLNQKNLEIEISNECQNIEPEKIRRLLKAFTLNEEAFHHSSGNGLGLSISQSLLKLHDSPLHFESVAKSVKVGFKIAQPD
jgi:two-component system sensor histidine kinase/response regulator